MVRQQFPNGAAVEPRIWIEEVTDPKEIEEFRIQMAAFKRNSDWLASHWGDLLPQVLGRFVAVSGQEAVIAETSEKALALAVAAHPDDKGVFVQYVSDRKGPRIYGHHG